MIDDATIICMASKYGAIIWRSYKKENCNQIQKIDFSVDAIVAFAQACYAAGQDAQMKHALYIGAVTEDGVVWANQNPSSYPVGAMFYAVIPKEP